MNSDPHDSTAWRSFGMLDAEQSSAFDEAMRHDPQLMAATREIDRLQAAIALVATRPVSPHEGHLERIQSRLRQQPKHGLPLWFGITGWAAAAALALLITWKTDIIRSFPAAPSHLTDSSPYHGPQAPHSPMATGSSLPVGPATQNTSSASHSPHSNTPSLIMRRENERLSREIAALHEQLQSHLQANPNEPQALPGIATPVIMIMKPPGSPTDDPGSLALNESPVSQLLVETLRISSNEKNPPTPTQDTTPSNRNPSFVASDTSNIPDAPPPSAIPIYDAARDSGTLVVTHLPPAAENSEYNLWVQPSPKEKPVHLGILPSAGTAPSESFDFSLGSHTVMPSGFILTQDPIEKPSPPNTKNTILQSPRPADP